MNIAYCLMFLLSLAGPIGAVTIPFDPSSGVVAINVVINGSVRGKFAIDTGADRLYIDRGYAIRNDLQLDSSTQRPIRGTSGGARAYSIDITSFVLGNDTLVNIPATAVDLADVGHFDGMAPMDGYIGSDILKQFYLVFDFPSGTLEIGKNRPVYSVNAISESVSFDKHRHLVLVDVSLNDSAAIPMILDYGATVVSLTPETARTLGLIDQVGRQQILKSMRVGDSTAVYDPICTISDLSNLKKSLPRAKFGGVIGATFLRHFKLAIDYESQEILFLNK